MEIIKIFIILGLIAVLLLSGCQTNQTEPKISLQQYDALMSYCDDFRNHYVFVANQQDKDKDRNETTYTCFEMLEYHYFNNYTKGRN